MLEALWDAVLYGRLKPNAPSGAPWGASVDQQARCQRIGSSQSRYAKPSEPANSVAERASHWGRWRVNDATAQVPKAGRPSFNARVRAERRGAGAAAVSGGSERASVDPLELPLTEHSQPGSYLVITASRTIYLIEVVTGDSSATITRYPRARSLLLDGEPLTGVRSFHFDPRSGLGQIVWWKENRADRDRPDEPYAGTVRTTSAVLLLLRVRRATEETRSRPADSTDTEELVDGLSAALAASEPDEDFVELLRALAQHGCDSPGTQTSPDDQGGAHGPS